MSASKTPTGTVLGLYTCARAGEPMEAHAAVEAVAARGLAGDRYADGVGTYSVKPNRDRELTLFASEALEALHTETGIMLAPEETRRNVITAGLALETLYGRRFMVGGVELEGVRECVPCGYLEKLTGKPVFKPLEGRGGLRAKILSSGTLRVGDAIRPGAAVAEAAAPIPEV